MQLLRHAVAKGTIWTLGGYAFTQALRFGTSVVVARILAPELFGIMVIVNTVRTGAELLSDIGISQSVIQARNAEDPDFYNTAWTLQILRGFALFAMCLLAAYPLASLYDNPSLTLVLPVSGLTFIFGGFASIGIPILRRKMDLAKLNAFEVVTSAAFSVFQIYIAYLYPTVWALVLGLLFGGLVNTVGSFFLVSDLSHRLTLSRQHILQILGFGKWIAISSAIYFATISFDRLYLATAVELSTIGVYGIARTISEIASSLFLRLSGAVIFPYIASMSEAPRDMIREKIAPLRFGCVITISCGLAFVASFSDLIILTLFDNRYQSAGWMLAVFMVGVWFAIISSLNEAALLGFGQSKYGAIANGVKFCWLTIALPLGFLSYGIVAAVLVVALSDLSRWIPISMGQRRERFSFIRQDMTATALLALVICLCLWLRWQVGAPLIFDVM